MVEKELETTAHILSYLSVVIKSKFTILPFSLQSEMHSDPPGVTGFGDCWLKEFMGRQ